MYSSYTCLPLTKPIRSLRAREPIEVRAQSRVEKIRKRIWRYGKYPAHTCIYTGTGFIKFEVPNRHPREDVK